MRLIGAPVPWSIIGSIPVILPPVGQPGQILGSLISFSPPVSNWSDVLLVILLAIRERRKPQTAI
jgi:hypothetical protein